MPEPDHARRTVSGHSVAEENCRSEPGRDLCHSEADAREGLMPAVDWTYIGLLAVLAVVAVSILRAI